ncbi:TetR family transcriptional regulator [Ruegeria sp. HKCCD4884]|uniref:TetR/AcrR family transcriptional regulator n=1 Tax=Ruegeria sp. HKCCD4884 TaxID=2683022 RepID=UPI001491C879|nr:TetR/AcrR family transcriptional regulator [Ruegeria sp. HKCCD4884]NOD92549.1 TetR family transcriptional regulator [Ruegeria sp. HKCCD4884]
MTSEEKILVAAEARVRTGGYNGFSFRDLARDTALTSAGVHHYFPTKADLVARLARNYTSRFLDALDECPSHARVARLRELFAESLRQDGKMCLCGLLAAESGGLPEPVTAAAKMFFAALVDRLVSAFPDSDDPLSDALAVLATLEGAALLVTVQGDPDVFEKATSDLGSKPSSDGISD